MQKKTKIDAFGAIALISFSLLLGINHVVIKIVNLGLNPIFFAGIRSFIAFIFIIIWMKLVDKPIVFNSKYTKISFIAGIIFALEFLFLFLALDFTTVSRNSIIYYSMPLWLTILLLFTKNNEKISFLKFLGLILAFIGVVLSVTNFKINLILNSPNLIGDILAVSNMDLLMIWIGVGIIFSLVIWRWSPLLLVTMSEDLASASGYNPKKENFVITLSLAIVVAVGIKVVGVLLIIALLIIPAASARSVASSPESMGIIAAIIGILSSILGLNSAYLFDTPTGPSIVCVASLFFFILMTVNVFFKNKI